MANSTLVNQIDPLDAGKMRLLQSVSASNQATVDLTNNIGTTYFKYIIDVSNLLAADDDVELRMRTSSDGGTIFDAGASDYGWVTVATTVSGVSVTFDTGGSATDTYMNLTADDVGDKLSNVTNEDCSGTIQVYNPAGSNITRINSDLSYTTAAGNPSWTRTAGCRKSTTPVNAFQILLETGNIISGEFRLYGVEGS